MRVAVVVMVIVSVVMAMQNSRQKADSGYTQQHLASAFDYPSESRHVCTGSVRVYLVALHRK